MNNFFRQLLGSLVQIGIGELTKRSAAKPTSEQPIANSEQGPNGGSLEKELPAVRAED